MSGEKKGIFILFLLLNLSIVSAGLLNPNEIGFSGQTLTSNYDTLVDSLYANSAVATNINGKLWVPWYTTSSSCQVSNLQRGGNCNSGQNIDSTHNCMVTDEFSQVGLLVSMGKNQNRMNEFYNTVLAIRSDKGKLPAWRVYRDGTTIQACRDGINGNCDTASDADARIISSLYTASKNSYFANSANKAAYERLANDLAKDFVQYEVLHSCKPSSLGQGNICYWLAAGAGAKSGGMGSSDFTYTGYFPDAIIAMLQACSVTGNRTYCEVADDFTLNYLQASNYNRQSFSAPPGMSFKWTNLGGVPKAECTRSCSPVAWDYADASRAVGICQANYYAGLMNHTLPLLQQYCNQWGRQHMYNANSIPIQYYPDGRALNSQSNYFAQGLGSLYQSGGHDKNLFKPVLRNALNHYTPNTRTWDNAQCFGVYMPAFAVRSLGFGLGRDEASFKPLPGGGGGGGGGGNSTCYTSVQNIPATCTGGQITQDVYDGCRTITCSGSGGYLRVMACNKPDSGPQYFEMYKQHDNAELRICLAGTCVNGEGYARSPNYPICNGGGGGGGRDPPVNNSGGIGSYNTSCTHNNQDCSEVSDVTSGDCRTVVFRTSSGPIQILACEKPGRVEVYRQVHPNNGEFDACVHTGCISENSGFGSFPI